MLFLNIFFNNIFYLFFIRAAERSGAQDPDPDSSLEKPGASLVEPETALENPNASLSKPETVEVATNPISVKSSEAHAVRLPIAVPVKLLDAPAVKSPDAPPVKSLDAPAVKTPDAPAVKSLDAPAEKASTVAAEKSDLPAEKSESSAESSGESPSPSLFQAFPPLKRIAGRRAGHSELPSFSNVFDTPFTDIINTKNNRVQIKNTPIITNNTLDNFLSTSSAKAQKIDDMLQKVTKLTNIIPGKDTIPLNKLRGGRLNMLSASPQPIDEAIKETVVAKYHPNMVPYLGMKMSCKVPSIDRLNGTLKFLGYINNLPKKSDRIIAGLELDGEQNLGTDGTFLGKRYFTAPPKRGYFVPFESCV